MLAIRCHDRFPPSGLFTARHLGDSMAAGVLGSTFFALANGLNPDHGMFSRDAAQVAYAPVFVFAIFTRVAPVGSTMLVRRFSA